MKDKTVTVDEYGVDPLSKTLLDEICNIREYTSVTVDARYVSNPQLLAYDRLGDVELYFVILLFNGMTNSFRLDRGQQILIPNAERVKEILSRRTVQKVQRISI